MKHIKHAATTTTVSHPSSSSSSPIAHTRLIHRKRVYYRSGFRLLFHLTPLKRTSETLQHRRDERAGWCVIEIPFALESEEVLVAVCDSTSIRSFAGSSLAVKFVRNLFTPRAVQ